MHEPLHVQLRFLRRWSGRFALDRLSRYELPFCHSVRDNAVWSPERLEVVDLIIEQGVAAEYEAALKAAEAAKGSTADPAPRRFFGVTSLDPILAKKQFADVVDEIVEQFTTKVVSEVTITVEVQAQSAAGFDEGVQPAVRENCKTLKFRSFDFEAEE